MGFLDCDADLQGTSFNQEHLQYSRGYWQFLIENVAPEWLDNPKGYLAVHWQSDTIPSIVYLIDLAKMFYSIINTITLESQSTFGGKLRQLLFFDGIQYQAQLTELIVGALLTRLEKPINMEPVSTMVASLQGATPGSVDYGIDWNDGRSVFVESTVFHVQQLLDWEPAVEDLKRQFERAMVRQSLNRALRITAPLELTRKTLSDQALKKALRIIAEEVRGSHSIKLVKEYLDLDWAPVPHIEEFADAGEIPFPGFVFTETEVLMAAATDVILKWPGGVEELVNRSLRNTLDGKRRQFELNSPYLLFMGIASNYIPLNGMVDLLTRRIYNNSHYRWLSSIGLLKVSFGQNVGHCPKVILLANPKASNPMPESFVAVLTGEGR